MKEREGEQDALISYTPSPSPSLPSHITLDKEHLQKREQQLQVCMYSIQPQCYGYSSSKVPCIVTTLSKFNGNVVLLYVSIRAKFRKCMEHSKTQSLVALLNLSLFMGLLSCDMSCDTHMHAGGDSQQS